MSGKWKLKKKNFGFKDFLIDTNLMAVAVSFILGMAFREIILNLIKYVIIPLLTGNEELEMKMGAADFGPFVSSVINFFITAITVFVIYKIYKRAGMMKTDK